MRFKGTGLSDPSISQWILKVVLDSLGLVGPRNLHPEQVLELHKGGWDHLEKPYRRPPSAPPADPGPPHFPLPEAGD